MNKIFGLYKVKNVNSMNILLFVFSLAYWFSCSTLHLKVTDFLTDWVETPWGKFIPRDSSIEVGVLISVLFFFTIIYKFSKGKKRLISSCYWLFVIISVFLSFRYLITAPIEIVHYPQYAILSFLIAKSVDPSKKKFLLGRILFWVTILGIIDEMDQYFYLTKQFTQYLDFNDFSLNTVGAAIGLMTYYGFADFEETKIIFSKIFNSLEIRITIIFFTVFFILIVVGIIVKSPPKEVTSADIINSHESFKIFLERIPGKVGSWQERDLGGYFYTLSYLSGSLLILIQILIFSLYSTDIFTKLKLLISKQKRFS
ncbi:MAG: hypothetical protein NTX65_12220 [Ignavibacteriales bacterium]|nr:hypothetical protein [Ignavibacteriales bacterium]